MERERAVALAEGVLERLVEGQGEWPLSVVRELYLFGSFARGALQPGDVDLNVEFDHHDKRWAAEVIQGLSYGYDPRRVFRQALVGRRRGVQFVFDGRADADFDMTLLWRRGEDPQTAAARLLRRIPAALPTRDEEMLPRTPGNRVDRGRAPDASRKPARPEIHPLLAPAAERSRVAVSARWCL